MLAFSSSYGFRPSALVLPSHTLYTTLSTERAWRFALLRFHTFHSPFRRTERTTHSSLSSTSSSFLFLFPLLLGTLLFPSLFYNSTLIFPGGVVFEETRWCRRRFHHFLLTSALSTHSLARIRHHRTRIAKDRAKTRKGDKGGLVLI
ncbi:uncharacterized protein K452DRAFT_124979 [Aplosporella prunicola CBS 121167]|uniref:Transmembrane protein n=1 Tax=Aplosporella prunicola CBS 121167 TaxID=1176127 RepID=A0A6A6BNV3_9PEZI|nr:uncharacterized protein K452DRAFT_124979 [Aplosporella prunicola CBS 121167]KAF2145756.1 hypothetical protein K452DRAFT_124979 [Aplosporella prunicola CBS 121167]